MWFSAIRPTTPPFSGGNSTNLAQIWHYNNFGSGQTVGGTPTDLPGWLGFTGPATIDTAHPDLGTTAMRLDAVQNSTIFGYLLGLPNNLVPGDMLWWSVRVYRPVGFLDKTSLNGHVKEYRFHTFQAGGANGGYDDIYINADGSFFFIYEGTQNPENLAGGSTAFAPTYGAYDTWDYCVFFDTVAQSNGGNAQVFYWKNKVLIAHLTDQLTMSASTYFCNEIHHKTYWNNGPPQNQSMWIGRYAVAAKIASTGRDDRPFLAQDGSGNKGIFLGF